MLDARLMQSFAQAAERGTVAAAADALGYTAPAVSQHIAKLEAELGTALFDRVRGRLRLTDAGRALLPLAQEMHDLDTRARAAVCRPDRSRRFRVAGFASAIAELILPRLHDLSRSMTVEIIEAEDADALRELSLGAVDLVLTQEYTGRPIERDPRYTYTPLVVDELKLVLPASYPSDATVADVRADNWLLNGTGTRCAQATTRILESIAATPSIVARVADNHTLLSLVAAGYGVTIVPELVVAVRPDGVRVAAENLGVHRTLLAVVRSAAVESTRPLVDVLLAARPTP